MTAREWAAKIQPGTDVAWRGLETAAFAGHPDVEHRIDPSGDYHGRTKQGALARVRSAVGGFFLVAGVVIGTIVIGFPSILGLTTLVGDRWGRSYPNPHLSVPVAGAIFAFAFAMLVVSFVSWVRRGRPKDAFREAQAFAAFLLGVPSVVIAWVGGMSAQVPGWQAWSAVMALTALAGAIYVAMLIVARRKDTARRLRARLRGDEPDEDPLPVEPVKRVRTVLDRLSEAERAEARADVAAAIDDLEQRGVISDEEARVARGAKLGALALRMYVRDERRKAAAPHP